MLDDGDAATTTAAAAAAATATATDDDDDDANVLPSTPPLPSYSRPLPPSSTQMFHRYE